MSQPFAISGGSSSPGESPHQLKVGTLSYTRGTLAILFLWLLWGDFCFGIMETVVPSILPLKLNALGASNKIIGLIVVTIPNLMNTVINPIVSFRSDRFRSRWGRRIPFLAGATPFLVLFLVLLGFSESIGAWLHHNTLAGRFSRAETIIWTIGVLLVGFQLFNNVINAVYWYTFNDVVPKVVLARFLALFRIVGGAAAAFYNFFIFKYAESHMREIFTWAALAYFVVFMWMCWKVKEGSYPPPPPNVGGRKGLLAGVQTYGSECFSNRFYWYFFLANSSFAMTWVTQSFQVFQLRSFGLDLSAIGKVAGIAGLVSTILLYPASIIADRLHPLRVLIAATLLMLLIQPLWLTFLLWSFSPSTAVALYAGEAIARTLYTASELPMYMNLLPRERYGQFCSANALVRSILIIFSGILCGAFLDALVKVFPAKDFCYRFLPCWNLLFGTASVLFLCLLYREWQRLGGAKGYQPPPVGETPAHPLAEIQPAAFCSNPSLP